MSSTTVRPSNWIPVLDLNCSFQSSVPPVISLPLWHVAELLPSHTIKMMASVFSSEQKKRARGSTLNTSQGEDKEQGWLSFANTETQKSER